MKERYHVSGMTCSACSAHVEKCVNRLDAVERASVNLLTETMEVVYDETRMDSTAICKAVEDAGYGAQLFGAAGQDSTDGKHRSADSEEIKEMRKRLIVSVVFLIPLMYVSMFHMIHAWFGFPIPEMTMRVFHGNENTLIFSFTQFLLVLPILCVNRKFFRVGFQTLRHLSPNMDSLIAVGAGAAMVYGVFAIYRIGWGLGHGDMALVEQYSGDLYFESAGMILTLITLGKYLETRSKGKTGEAITKLMDLSPQTAIRLTQSGDEEEIPTQLLAAGDIFLVKPGSRVPVDGTVLEGNSGVDESAITGESIPVEKRPGDKVISATINRAGFLKCRADRVGDATTLAQIIRLVEEASASKAPIAQLADKVAGVFVPVVMGIALLTLLVWFCVGAGAEFAISSAIAVLVISCPCALGLATPVAIMVGTGVGAGNGILIKSGEALQRAQEIDTVVLDKTGTITEGNLTVLDMDCPERGMSAETMLTAAAALERMSEHPLAEAVLREADRRKCPKKRIRDFNAVFGRGISGVTQEDICVLPDDSDGPTGRIGGARRENDVCIAAGSRIFIGNLAFLEENGFTDPAAVKSAREAADQKADEGQTPLLVAMKVPGDPLRLIGVIGVADTVKKSSEQAISAWRRMGIRVVMLTGDNKRTAEAVQRRLKLTDVIAEVLPRDKERYVSKLKEAGRRVAMIGDGINDAPALAAADVGMAIGAGTDVAMESADIVLMKSDLRDAVTAMKLSRAVIRNIRQNLFWAFFYNSIGIPLAAGLLYPAFGLRLTPMFGAAAMSMSSIFVVGNALRLRRFQSGFRDLEQDDTVLPGKVVEGEKPGKVEEPGNRENSKKEENTETEGSKTMKKKMTIEGMMCGHCTGRVQKVLEALDGVSAVEMSLENKTATVFLEKEVAEEILSGAVTEAGYEVIKIETE